MVELNGIYYLYFLFSTFVLKLVKPYKFEAYNKNTIDVRALRAQMPMVFLILVAFTTANTSLCRYGKQRISELR